LTLNGKTPNGTWQLRMVDSATQDLGSLLSWSLQLVHQ
jgi:subtilisin-like proprotein convertase family protein